MLLEDGPPDLEAELYTTDRSAPMILPMSSSSALA